MSANAEGARRIPGNRRATSLERVGQHRPGALLDLSAFPGYAELSPQDRKRIASYLSSRKALRKLLGSEDNLAKAKGKVGLRRFHRHIEQQDLPPRFKTDLIDLVDTFHPYFSRPDGTIISMADRHLEFWRWVFGLRLGQAQHAFVSVWSRGGGKSTSVELAVAQVARRRTRRYGLYVSETQLQADTHVGNVGQMLEQIGIERSVTKYGSIRSWRRNRLIAKGFALDAFGLDVALRGSKIDEMRPDFIVVDDVDGAHDSPGVIAKKIHTITHSLLPAGATSLAVLAVQNLPNLNGVFAQLADGRAEWLMDRQVSGPYPAVEGLEVEREQQDDGPTLWRIVAGEPTWEGQNLVDCEAQINTFGLRAFLSESQHEGHKVGGLFDRDWFEIVDGFPHEARLVRFWDMAGRNKKPGANPGDPDYAVGCLMAAHQGQFWIVDVQRLRGTPLEVETRIKQTAALDTRRVPIYIEQEGGSAGEFVIDKYKREVLPGYAVYAVKPVQAKEVRAAPLASAAQSGNVFLVAGRWNSDFLDEIDGVFGGGAEHDDQADGASGAHCVLSDGAYAKIDPEDLARIPGAERAFQRGGSAGRQPDVPPSKRAATTGRRW